MAIVQNQNPGLTTLSNFGVPVGPNGQGPGNGGFGLLMPKLKNRFQIELTNFADSSPGSTRILTRQVVTCARPSLQFNSTALHSYNNIVYIPQKPEWTEIELTLRDDITNELTSAVSFQLQRQMNHYTQSAAAAGSDFKFQMYINVLDGTISEQAATSLESWYLEGCYIQQAQYDSLDYSSSDPVMITLTIRYDNATQGDEANIPLPVRDPASNAAG